MKQGATASKKFHEILVLLEVTLSLVFNTARKWSMVTMAALLILFVEHFSFCLSSGSKQKYVLADSPTKPPPLHSTLKSPDK